MWWVDRSRASVYREEALGKIRGGRKRNGWCFGLSGSERPMKCLIEKRSCWSSLRVPGYINCLVHGEFPGQVYIEITVSIMVMKLWIPETKKKKKKKRKKRKKARSSLLLLFESNYVLLCSVYSESNNLLRRNRVENTRNTFD